MRITYDISYEEFAAVQAPFRGKQQGRGLYRVGLGFSAIIALAGFVPLLFRMGDSSGGLAMRSEFALFFLLLGCAGGGASYWLNKRGQKRFEQARLRHGEGVRRAYQNLHCRDQRTIEVSESGFMLSCRCGQVTRPWTELMSFSENGHMLGLGTKTELILVSKRAFSSPGQVTEFRALVLDALERQKKPVAPYVDFAYAPPDFTRAQLLHIRRGGGWRPLARRAIILSAISFFALAAAFAGRRAHYGVMPWFTMPFLIAFWMVALVVHLLNKVRSAKHYFGPMRVWIGEDGISLRDQATESRFGWQQYIGYLEDSRIYLLYHTHNLYRILPKRIFDQRRQQDFSRLLTSKLPPYGGRLATPPPPVSAGH